MILCYEGTPGSGKTYDAVNKVIQNLRLGRVVYSNIDGFDFPDCREHIKIKTGLDDYELSKRLVCVPNSEMIKIHETAKQGSLLVYDEVHKLFSNREWQTATNKVFAEWASTHRHGGYDVVLITQNLEKVDSHVRGLVEFTYRYKKNNYFGKFFENRFFCYAYSEDSTKVIGRRQGKYDSSIFPCYNSYSGKDIKELGVQSNVNILKHPIFYAIPVLLLIFAYLFTKSSFASGDLFGAKSRLVKEEVQKNPSVKVFEEPMSFSGSGKKSSKNAAEVPSKFGVDIPKVNIIPKRGIVDPSVRSIVSQNMFNPVNMADTLNQGINTVKRVITGFGSYDNKVFAMVQGKGAVEMQGYQVVGDVVCKDDSCLSIGDLY